MVYLGWKISSNTSSHENKTPTIPVHFCCCPPIEANYPHFLWGETPTYRIILGKVIPKHETFLVDIYIYIDNWIGQVNHLTQGPISLYNLYPLDALTKRTERAFLTFGSGSTDAMAQTARLGARLGAGSTALSKEHSNLETLFWLNCPWDKPENIMNLLDRMSWSSWTQQNIIWDLGHRKIFFLLLEYTYLLGAWNKSRWLLYYPMTWFEHDLM